MLLSRSLHVCIGARNEYHISCTSVGHLINISHNNICPIVDIRYALLGNNFEACAYAAAESPIDLKPEI